MPNTHLLVGHGAHRVIALHGWFGHAGGWGPLTQHLNGRDFSYAFMDQRGYGGMRGSGGPYTVEQIAQDALALADQLGWQRFSLIGHSMGGSAIQQVLVAAPARVRALVAVTPVSATGVPFDDQGWQLFTAAGVLLGARLPADWPLDFALPLTFIAIVVPLIRNRTMLAVAAVSGIVALLAAGLPFKLGLLVAALAGMAVGWRLVGGVR